MKVSYKQSLRNMLEFRDKAANKTNNRKKTMNRINRLIRLYKHQHGNCFCCDQPMIWTALENTKLPYNYATFEHVVPKSDTKGSNGTNNYVLTCNRCNQLRGKMDIFVFVVAVQLDLSKSQIRGMARQFNAYR